MHLWPSMRLRDSFKIGYLKKIEWNLHKMNTEKKNQQSESSNNQQKLLDSEVNDESTPDPMDHPCARALLLCRELFMLLSCCYCCFCCGACTEDEESSY